MCKMLPVDFQASLSEGVNNTGLVYRDLLWLRPQHWQSRCMFQFFCVGQSRLLFQVHVCLFEQFEAFLYQKNIIIVLVHILVHCFGFPFVKSYHTYVRSSLTIFFFYHFLSNPFLSLSSVF